MAARPASPDLRRPPALARPAPTRGSRGAFRRSRREVGALRGRGGRGIGGIAVPVAEAAGKTGTGPAALRERVAGTGRRLEAVGEAPDAAAAAGERGREPRKLAVLRVEDAPGGHAFPIDRLRRHGHRLHGVTPTAAGLAAAASWRCDLVIPDPGRREEGRSTPLAGLDLLRAPRHGGMKLPAAVFAGRRLQDGRDRLAAGARFAAEAAVDPLTLVDDLGRTG